MITLDDLASERRWVAWRNERRGPKLTKVPYTETGRKAQANNPETWRILRNAEGCARSIVNGLGGGTGIMLGYLGEVMKATLFGIDLDTCRDPATGTFEPWAAEVIDRFDSYTEVSPSGTGAKIFALIDNAAIEEVRAATEIKYGKTFARRNDSAEHPPAIEVHIGNRYFAVTGQRVDGGPAELAPVPPETLLWLLCEHGPAFAGNPTGKPKGRSGTDKSRSATAFRKGAELRRAGKTFEEMCEALRADPDTADWYREKGEANGQRELKRIWDKAGGDDAPWFSDDWLALRFAERHASELRFCALWGDWLQWHSSYWKNEKTLRVFDLARTICRQNAATLTDVDTLAKAVASAKTVAAVATLARSDRRLAASHDQWDTDIFTFNCGKIDR